MKPIFSLTRTTEFTVKQEGDREKTAKIQSSVFVFLGIQLFSFKNIRRSVKTNDVRLEVKELNRFVQTIKNQPDYYWIADLVLEERQKGGVNISDTYIIEILQRLISYFFFLKERQEIAISNELFLKDLLELHKLHDKECLRIQLLSAQENTEKAELLAQEITREHKLNSKLAIASEELDTENIEDYISNAEKFISEINASLSKISQALNLIEERPTEEFWLVCLLKFFKKYYKMVADGSLFEEQQHTIIRTKQTIHKGQKNEVSQDILKGQINADATRFFAVLYVISQLDPTLTIIKCEDRKGKRKAARAALEFVKKEYDLKPTFAEATLIEYTKPKKWEERFCGDNFREVHYESVAEYLKSILQDKNNKIESILTELNQGK